VARRKQGIGDVLVGCIMLPFYFVVGVFGLWVGLGALAIISALTPYIIGVIFASCIGAAVLWWFVFGDLFTEPATRTTSLSVQVTMPTKQKKKKRKASKRVVIEHHYVHYLPESQPVLHGVPVQDERSLVIKP